MEFAALMTIDASRSGNTPKPTRQIHITDASIIMPKVQYVVIFLPMCGWLMNDGPMK